MLAAAGGRGEGLPPHPPCLHREPRGPDAAAAGSGVGGGDCVGGGAALRDGEGLALCSPPLSHRNGLNARRRRRTSKEGKGSGVK